MISSLCYYINEIEHSNPPLHLSRSLSQGATRVRVTSSAEVFVNKKRVFSDKSFCGDRPSDRHILESSSAAPMSQ